MEFDVCEEIMVNERELRNTIRKVIKESSQPEPSKIVEAYTPMDSGEFYKVFVEPWKEVVDVVKLETQRTVANVWVNLRLLTTFNSQKADRIIARHKDRIKNIDNQVNDILDKGEMGDFKAMAFIFNPGMYLLGGAASTVVDPTKQAAIGKFFKEAGVGDFEVTPGASGGGGGGETETHADKQRRKESERGPVRKALTALEQIFLLAHHEIDGESLHEQDEPGEKEEAEPEKTPENPFADLNPEEVNKKISDSAVGKEIAELRKEYEEDYKEAADFLNSLKLQAEFFASLASIKNSKELTAKVSKLESAANSIGVKTDLGAINQFSDSLKKDTEAMVADESTREIVVKEILKEKGIDEPTPEDAKDISDSEITKRAGKLAWDQVIMQAVNKSEEQIEKLTEIGKNIVESLTPPDFQGDALAIFEASPVGELFKGAEATLSEMENISVQPLALS